MKKYLSCIILIILCITCATIFYVNANVLEEEPSKEADKSPDKTDKESPAEISINKTGTVTSEHLTDCNLRIEWAIYKEKGEDKLYVSAQLFLDTPEQITKAGGGYLSINGKKQEFETTTMVGKENLLSAVSCAIDFSDYGEIVLEGYLDICSYTSCKDELTELRVNGTVKAQENEEIPKSYLIELKHISKFPELPSGDEVTSLCMVLNHLGYNVDKRELSDLYLMKGPAHHTNIFEANAGNPEDAYNSYGCMPPVIVNAANKYIGINGGKYYARDISRENIDALYCEVSKGNPIIVWACEEFDTTPSVFRTLIIDGKTVYLKSNVNTLVLIGYDYEKSTVTLANPSGTVFEMDMSLFELRFNQVGSYAVLIK